MARRGVWIAAVAGLAAVLWIVIAMRGPASGRAPVPHGGAPDEPGVEPVRGGASFQVTVAAEPTGSAPQWVLQVRDSAGRVREEKGTGGGERAIGSLPPGRAHLAVRAPGFVGESRRLEILPSENGSATLALRQFGRVSGVVRCEGAPVAGVLVRLAMPTELAHLRLDLAPEDRAVGMEQSVETGSDGSYRFDRVLPGPGYALVAAGFDHAPVRAGPVDLRPGEETKLDITVLAGVHLSGRLVDLAGAPCKGATVNVLQRHDMRSAFTWMDEARARTDEDGRFVTPALTGTAMRMLKAWVVVNGVHQVVQHETVPPDRGTKDVGTLAPHPGIVSFEMEGPPGEPPATLTVSVNAAPAGNVPGQTVILAGATFDKDGRLRLAGLPIGEGSYAVISGDHISFADGTFRPTGSDMTVKIPPLRTHEEKAPPAEQLIVDVAPPAEPALLVLIADSVFAMAWRIEKGSRTPIVERVPPGRYTLLLCAGDRYGREEITQVAGQDTKVALVADRLGRSLSVLVLDGGKPCAGATVSLRGFQRESRGEKVPWGKTGVDGRVVLRGLPPETAEIAILAMTEDFGRGRWFDITGKTEISMDIAETPPED